MVRPLFVLSGIGGDERLFHAQRAVRDIRPIPWIAPAQAREPVTEYAARLAREFQFSEPFDLGGSSFGGMIALELARHLAPRNVFLFGSCRSPDSVAPLLRALRSLPAVAPDWMLHPPRIVARWFGATTPAEIDLFARMLAATPPVFIRWASRAIFDWPGVAQLPMPIHHVHGDRDRLIPVHRVRPDCVVPGAGHLLNLTHAAAVNGFLATAERITRCYRPPVLHRLTNHAATLGRFAREQVLELIAAALAAGFLLTRRVTPRDAIRAVDFDLLFVLIALLITVEILRESGYVDRFVASAVARFGRTRTFAAALIAMSGALAAVMTNDVALFVVIPFTVVAGRLADFDIEDAVILEIVAANLLGCLTPLGNPQNLFVFHQSGWTLGRFVAVMAPFVAWCAIGLAIGLLLLGRSKKMIPVAQELPPLRPRLAWAGLICAALVLLEVARVIHAWPAAVAALIAGILCLRGDFFDVDLSIVPLFFFAFIAVEGLRTFDVHTFLHANVYVLAIGLSQVISNVPATILLSPLATNDWQPLLYGANAGGCGTIIASLANLLGWRIYVRECGRDPRFLRRLLAINFAFLAWAAMGGWGLLRF